MNRQRKQWISQIERTLWRAARRRSPARCVVVTADAEAPVTALELEQLIRRTGHAGRATIYYALVAIATPALEDALSDVGDRLGVTIETERLVLHGICPACGALAGAGASAVPGAQPSPTIGLASRAQV